MLVLLLVAPSSAGAATVSNCGWPAKSDPNFENLAYPDQSATYWATPFEAIPGAEMTITGRFPLARYMSFHLYEGDAAVDSVTDYQIRPASGQNPYVPRAARNTDGTYTLHVVLGKRPANPAPNTLYAGSLNGEPNPAGFIIYRLYLPQGDGTGGVPLPNVTYTSATSGTALPCPDTSTADQLALNELLASSSSPSSTNAHPSSLSWGVVNSHTASKTTVGSTTLATSYDGNFGNRDNTYLSLFAAKIQGDVVAFRAEAPTYAQTVGAATMPDAQVRYFSICTNELASTRFVQCLPDQSLKVDADGYFNVVIGDAAHKPHHLSSVDNWIPDGPYPDVLVLYRQMVPNPAFGEASANVTSAADAPKQMGAYYPETVQCTTTAFDRNRCGLTVPRRAAASPWTTTRRRCTSRHTLSFVQHPRAPVRETRAVVEINGRTVKRLRGHAIRRVTLHRPARAKFTLTLITTLSSGEVVRRTYTYRGCTVRTGRAHVLRHPRKHS